MGSNMGNFPLGIKKPLKFKGLVTVDGGESVPHVQVSSVPHKSREPH